MKRSTLLKISLLLLILGFLGSCKSRSFQPIHRSSVPAHCNSAIQRAPSKGRKAPEHPPSNVTPNNRRAETAGSTPMNTTRSSNRRAEAPPSRVTPIGGNFSVRN